MRKRLLPLLLATLILVNPIYGLANSLPSVSNADVGTTATIQTPTQIPPIDGVVVETTVEGQTVDQVAHEVLEADPTATVLVDEGSPAPTSTVTSPAAPTTVDSNADVVLQQADDLNTGLTLASYCWDNCVYLISSRFTWLQTASLILFNTAYTKTLGLQLGLWSRIMQVIEKPLVKGMTFVKIPLKPAQIASQYMAHGTLIYIVYALMQIFADVPNMHAGFLSLPAQLNIIRKGGFGFMSGFGWALLSRKWDPLKENQRPISRQAFNTFNSVRGMVIGIFLPFLISTKNSVGIAQFALHNIPFLISATAGTSFFFFGDQILRRYPQIGRALERFQKVTERINDHLVKTRVKVTAKINEKLKQMPICSKLLSRKS